MSQGKAFDRGAIVRLKSGGPMMTVSAQTAKPGTVVANWFRGDELITWLFDYEQLFEVPVELAPALGVHQSEKLK